MRKRLLTGVLAAGMMTAMLPGVASAAINMFFPGCPPEESGFERVQLTTPIDRNGNGSVCQRIGTAPDEPPLVLIDDNMPLRIGRE